jgi:hypothetical protein
MARRKPRKNVGPQPHHNPKRAQKGASGAGGGSAPPKRKPGEPHPPSFRGVAIRAAIVAALFFPYLVYIAGHSMEAAAVVTVIAFALMLPLGMVMDRFRYRRQMTKWLEKQGKGRPPKTPPADGKDAEKTAGSARS